MMSSAKKAAVKKKKEKKAEPKKDLPPQVVTRQLGDNMYTGIIREDPLGSQFLETGAAKYMWNTGISYEGPFASSQIEGKGKFSWPDGSSYEGELHNGKRHGEGLYIGCDGITKYEGQWCMGKREGHGRLLYNASGTAFYDGEWKDGKKEGEGKQVWPSGNVYEGQWVLGKMSGYGMMMWRTGSILERYTGFWKDNDPHGEGTHTWLSAEPLPEGASKESLQVRPAALASQHQQQQNNRYTGQWHRGKRDGVGTFYYANGAYYHGEWRNHVKQGHGRHTFEDGHTYEGPFEDDRMTHYVPPQDPDENPVCRRIDISDLRVIALPADHSGFEVTAGSRYLDPEKIFREVYNKLLFYLSELKELYNRYRALLPIPGEDPFILKNHQLWMFARDAGLVTPRCPLSRLDRFVHTGPRHHLEVAPEGSRDARPLTPRANDNRGSIDSVMDGGAAKAEHSRAPSQASQGESSEEEESASMDSSMPSPAHMAFEGAEQKSPGGMKSPPATTDQQGPVQQAPASAPFSDGQGIGQGMRFLCRRIGLSEGLPVSAKTTMEAEEVEASSKAELEDSGQSQPGKSSKPAAEIHQPSKSLLFRQFLDGVVRISLACFPHERGLEAQIHRLFRQLFKEQTLPAHDPKSEEVWSFLVQQEFRQTLEEFGPALWHLFRGAVAGREVGVLDDRKSMQRFNVFGAPKRQSRSLARVDETVRLKDVLRLVSRLGLFRPILASSFPQDDPCVPVNAIEEEDGGDDGNLSADENGSAASNSPEQDGIDEEKAPPPKKDKDLMSAFESKVDPFDASAPFDSKGPPFGVGASRLSFMPKSSLLNSDDGNVVPDDVRAVPSSTQPKRRKTKYQEAKQATAEGPAVPRPDDFARCDVRITPLVLLRSAAEAMSPGSFESVHWEVNPEQFQLSDESVSLLEFVETEVVFSEFVRILVHLVDHGTLKDATLCARLPLPKRFDGFLRYVLFPALEMPYTPPEMPPTMHRSDTSHDPAHTDLETASATGQEVTDSASQVLDGAQGTEADPAEAVPPPPATVDLWHGFEEGATMTSLSRAPRRWPKGYEQQVLKWR
mmetsp:Transcript_53786/g.149248  ORF Transcript_53786/g.149248 Transcript_53786/m.149248 type:complete len:1067 (-) Transcript_53786:248-3448(-)